MSSRVLILPIETKARELHGKLLLAKYAAEAGFRVLIGDQRIVAASVHRMPRGIYLDKSVSRTKVAHYRRLKQLGYSIAAWCEEGLVYRDKKAYQFERISPEAMDLVDAFFAWGDVHRHDVIEAVPEATDKIHAIGNPRFDLLRNPYRAILDAEACELKERFGRFVFVVTTFSRYNKYPGRDDILEVLRARGFVLTPQQKAHYRRLVEHLGQVFDAFGAMVPALASAFPDRTIIVRPHPSENHEYWRSALSHLDNVQVIYEGNVEPWLCAAEAVIHNASTAGIEAFMLARPVISYMPVIDETFNRLTHLPNSLSETPHTLEDLMRAVRSIRRGNSLDATVVADRNARVESCVANAAGPFASEKIVNRLVEIRPGQTPSFRARLDSSRAHAWLSARQTAAGLMRHVRSNGALGEYMDQKFPGLAIQEIQTVLDQLASINPAEKTVSAVPHPDLESCFEVKAD